MKRYLIASMFSLLMVCSFMSAWAQAPDRFSYQAVIRNAGGDLVSNQPVSVRVRLLKGSATGGPVYEETHGVSANANGLVSFEIGGGTVISGDLAVVAWEDGPYFINTATDPSGGSSYSIEVTHQLLSVPYALYARTAQSALQDQDGQELSINGHDLSITNGNTVTLPSGGAPSGNAGGDLAGTYPNPTLAANAVTTVRISNEAVTVDKIAANAVVTAKINNGAVTADKLSAGAVTNAKLANASVTADKLSGTGAAAGNILLYNGTVWTPAAESFARSGNDLVADKNVYALEYNRIATGDANMVPVAYGKVRGSDGMLYTAASTANVSVTRTGPGNYEVAIAGETYGFSSFNTIAGLDESTVPGFVLPVAVGNKLHIRTYNLAGSVEDRSFSFLVHKK